jgi:YHS domain-containing protein
MKKALLISMCTIAAVAAFAGPGKDKAAKATIKCAVTHESVNIADATKNKMYADYKGRRYFFCCNGCPQSFKKEPAKYAKSDSIKTPKAEKKK